MGEWNDEALILRFGRFHEKDMWLKMLLREHGVCTIFAFGGSVSKRRFCGCLDVFNSLSCRIRHSRNGYLNLEEATLLAGPRALRANWQAMGMAANCLRFLEAAGADAASSAQCFALAENLRLALERNGKPPALLPQFFRLRMAAILGMAPQLEHCAHCGEQIRDNAIFRISAGTIHCAACASQAPGSRFDMVISPAVASLLRKVQQTMPSQWPGEPADSREKRACSRLIDSFVQYHLGLEWDNGFFRRL